MSDFMKIKTHPYQKRAISLYHVSYLKHVNIKDKFSP